jgi:hypothetical protein
VAEDREPDDLPGAPGARIRDLLKQAAAMRDACRPWPEVAQQVGRSHSQVTKWPTQFPARWELYSRQARHRREEQFDGLVQRLTAQLLEGGIEAVVILRSLMRGKLPEAKDGTKGDSEEGRDGKPRLLVGAQTRESAAHSLMAAVLKVVGERKRIEFEDVSERRYADLDDEELIERAYPGLHAVR